MNVNGEMQINQRNYDSTTTVSVNASSSTYNIDMFRLRSSGTGASGTYTAAKVEDGPEGFKFSMKLQVTGTDSTLSSGEYNSFFTVVEGRNHIRTGFGGSGAKNVMLSFYVKSNLTGGFGGSIINGNNNRSFAFNYTINSANTWERKVISIPGDTSGAWYTDERAGVVITFSLGVGSGFQAAAGSWQAVEVMSPNSGADAGQGFMSSTDNNIYFTGIQYEVGTSATPYEHKSYHEELLECQRYFCAWHSDQQLGMGQVYSGSGYVVLPIVVPVQMRSKPSVSKNGSYWFVSYHGNSGYAGDRSVTVEGNGGAVPQGWMYRLFVAGGSDQGNAVTVWCLMHDNSSQYMYLSSEY
jgi:hypothetical protein